MIPAIGLPSSPKLSKKIKMLSIVSIIQPFVNIRQTNKVP
jgi:hypothetical protein